MSGSPRFTSSRFVLPVKALRDDLFIRHFVALMTFMVMITASVTLFLFALSHQWTADVLEAATVELPAASVESLPALENALSRHPDIKAYDILTKDQVLDLISPWFGKETEDLANTISVPILIPLQFRDDANPDLKTLEESVQSILPEARLVTHQDWLNPLERLTGLLETVGVVSLALLFLALLLAIHGAARGRVATHRDALNLLHLMGATDSFIGGQFQLYFLRLLWPGLMHGFLGGIIAIAFAWLWLSGDASPLLQPFDVVTVLLLLACLIGLGIALLGLLAVAARHAVSQTLNSFAWV
jgi:cell division transport system permease protein